VEFNITLIIVILTCIISIRGFSHPQVIDDLIFYPPAIDKRRQYYRYLSHGFIHADGIHLAFNMLALYSFGGLLESIFSNYCVFDRMGRLYFVILYFTALVIASVPDYLRYRDSYHFRSLGASGAVSAVIFAAIVVFPQMPIRLFFIPVDIPGYLFGVVYLLLSAYLDRRGGGNINHSAHFWGAAYGILFTLVMGQLFGKLDMYENFMRQLRSIERLLVLEC
jgi:membrane associated rhomboid family serine protease